jgi:hypothetical protein
MLESCTQRIARDDTMTAAKQIEYAIARRLIRRGATRRLPHNAPADSQCVGQLSRQVWADRLIAVLAATVGLAVVGSFAEELLWVVVAVATVITLK